ncbi:MAG: hypothetical protein GAK30_01554 [Paracidovorax wautersii]|uniref:Zinc finger Ogr/Delta-type domain-containing protein n=1 Tax=Paracidovorax wautersii TaxID=1177982 RepID=A0A7V8JQL4_9BURK|nr:MAG: hypothetical protein GAK30_01554 [Paracidovorax wautersii]
MTAHPVDHPGADAAADSNNRYLRITIECPHCGTRCVACDSRAMSRTMREITYKCRNWRCGFCGVATLEFARTLTLPSAPAADIRLPLSRHIRRGQLALALAETADEEAAAHEYAAALHTPENDWDTTGSGPPAAPPG